ncbi:MAP6 domain-containing protein 1 isoform X2 [Arapaima gigas]
MDTAATRATRAHHVDVSRLVRRSFFPLDAPRFSAARSRFAADMAWPCMSRVCCWARFWNQVDRSDLAVPLTIHNYSDMWEMEAQSSGPGLGHPSRGPRDLEPPDYSGLQDAPLPTVSLYKQDFKAWPLPTKQVSHWRSDGRGHLGSSGRQKKFKRRDRREGSVAQLQEEVFPADWCRYGNGQLQVGTGTGAGMDRCR